MKGIEIAWLAPRGRLMFAVAPLRRKDNECRLVIPRKGPIAKDMTLQRYLYCIGLTVHVTVSCQLYVFMRIIITDRSS